MRDAEKGLTTGAERIGTANNARRLRRTNTNKPNTGTAAKTITNSLSDGDGGEEEGGSLLLPRGRAVDCLLSVLRRSKSYGGWFAAHLVKIAS